MTGKGSDPKIAVLISGRGSNLQALIDAGKRGHLGGTIAIVIANRPDAAGLTKAQDAGIATLVVDHKQYADRAAFERALVDVLRERGVRLVCLAGFMRLLGQTFLDAFPNAILNVHPALLPAFPGLHAQRQALEYGVRIAGCTVHLVDDKTDHGPIVIQAAVPVYSDDTLAELTERILAEEHRIYPEAICLFAEGAIRVEGRRVVIRDEEPLADRALVNPALG